MNATRENTKRGMIENKTYLIEKLTTLTLHDMRGIYLIDYWQGGSWIKYGLGFLTVSTYPASQSFTQICGADSNSLLFEMKENSNDLIVTNKIATGLFVGITRLL